MNFHKYFIATALILLPSYALAYNKIQISSDKEENINQGQDLVFINQNSIMKAQLQEKASGQAINLNIQSEGSHWALNLQSINGALTPGVYNNASRYPFNSNKKRHGISISKNGRSCNKLEGEFEIKQISVVNNKLDMLEASFVQRCENKKPALRGYVLYNASQASNKAVNNCQVKLGDEFSELKDCRGLSSKDFNSEKSPRLDSSDELELESDVTISGQITATVVISNPL